MYIMSIVENILFGNHESNYYIIIKINSILTYIRIDDNIILIELQENFLDYAGTINTVMGLYISNMITFDYRYYTYNDNMQVKITYFKTNYQKTQEFDNYKIIVTYKCDDENIDFISLLHEHYFC